jgi:ribosomal protein S18 acetylase RimI-like enzyme
MEILDLRHLRSHDLERLLEEEKALWQKDLAWDYSASVGMIQRYLDAAALPGYAAIDRGRAVGYSFYVQEHYKGVVGDVFVSEGPGAEETELELLTQTIETLQATPGIRRIEAQLMTLRHPPSSDFFMKRGLQSFRRQFMVLSLNDAPSLPPAPAAGVRVEAWDPRWKEAAARLIARSYRGHIDSSISDQYRSHGGALRFLDNIVRYPGCGEFDPDCSFLAFCGESQDTLELRGMALSSTVGEQVSHITQVCVYPELQGTGIGRMLMGQIIQKLRERQARAATLTVTSSNSRAIRLYRQLNFSILKEFYALAWDSPDGENGSSIFRRG